MTVTTAVLCYVATPRTPQEHVAASTVILSFCIYVYLLVHVLSNVSVDISVYLALPSHSCLATLEACLRFMSQLTLSTECDEHG